MQNTSSQTWPGIVFLLLILTAASFEALSEDEKAPTPECWPAEQTRQFFTELEQRHGGNKSLAAVFDQEKHLQMLKTPLKAQGRICFAPPGHLRFEITHPFQSVLLYNAGNIQRFELEDGKWKTLDARAVRVMTLVMEQISQWMQGKFEAQSPVFDTFAAPAPDQCVTVLLRPKHERFREFIAGIDITLGPAPERRVQRITVREPGGDYTEMRFTKEWHALELPENIFTSPEMPDDLALLGGDNTP